MQNQLRIALTGGIASGKSSVCRLFSELGIDIIDTDKIARELFAPSSPLLLTLRDKFGDSIFNEDKTLNRKSLRTIVFSNENHLTWLNQLTHPKIRLEVIRQLEKSSSPYSIIDIPLLITREGELSKNMTGLFDRVLVVSVDKEVQISRLIKRDNSDTENAQKIIDSQSSTQQKIKFADEIIDNNGALSELEQQVSLLHNKYMALVQQSEHS